MAKIVYCWELGADLGHISSFVPLAKQLIERGHEVTMILREVQRARSVLGSLAIRVFSAPVWVFSPVVAPKPTGTYTDILFHFGYLDPAGLGGIVSAWRELYRLLSPDLILADHAPTALLAARTAGVKALTYGSGFFAPPSRHPFPSMQDGPFAASTVQIMRSEAKALATVNAVLQLFSLKSFSSLAELFPEDRNLLLTYHELDHYSGREGGAYYGVVANAAGTAVPEWPAGAGKKVFAYLKTSYPHFERVLASLASLGCSTVVFAGGIPERDRIAHTSSKVQVSRQAVDIHWAMRECDLAVCHSGIGTIVPALLAGKPLLLLPMQGEQTLMAARVASLGAALTVPMGSPPLPNFAEAIRRLLSDRQFTKAAEVFAQRHSSPSQSELVGSLADRCEQELSAPAVEDAMERQ